MRLRPPAVLLLLVCLLAALAAPARATFPFPTGGPGADPYDYTRLHITNGSCTPLAPGQSRPPGSDLPSNFDCRNNWKLTDYAAQPGDPDYDPAVAKNPQELHGVKGAGVNRAWEVTTGRPDTVLAVLDSGIEWNTPELVNKVWLNWRELPLPCAAAPCTHQLKLCFQYSGSFFSGQKVTAVTIPKATSAAPMIRHRKPLPLPLILIASIC